MRESETQVAQFIALLLHFREFFSTNGIQLILNSISVGNVLLSVRSRFQVAQYHTGLLLSCFYETAHDSGIETVATPICFNSAIKPYMNTD